MKKGSIHRKRYSSFKHVALNTNSKWLKEKSTDYRKRSLNPL